MAYDAKDGYVVLYGGLGNAGDLSDTWKFVGGIWTKLAPSGSPPPLVAASMVFDKRTSSVVLFGGRYDNISAYYNETWTYSSGSWTLQTTPVSPLPRDWASMTYDGFNHYLVLFGGSPGYGGGVLGDTWTMGATGSWNYRFG